MQHEKAKAIRWLLNGGQDFETVCLNAGLDPQSIREKSQKAIERGCVWRQGMEKRSKNPATTPKPLERKFSVIVNSHYERKPAPSFTSDYSSYQRITTTRIAA